MRGSLCWGLWVVGIALSSACGDGPAGGAPVGGELDSGQQEGGPVFDASLDTTPDVVDDAQAGVADADAGVASNCSDGVQNGNESDVDCGGSCAACAPGNKCQVATDCESWVCAAGVCAEPQCDDGVKNGSESDVDCGGGCTPCPTGKGCSAPADCSTGVCKSGSCWDATCADGVKNGLEKDVDCGGNCVGCDPGKACSTAEDCSSKHCDGGSCAAPTCSDLIANGGETDVDCGGTCPACDVSKACNDGNDCVHSVCTAGQCATASCDDSTKNGSETGVDCGGGTCPPCTPGGGCSGPQDCESGVCAGGSCGSATCGDGVQNGAETDVDCGGGTCPGCATSGKCSSGGDCTDSVCVEGVCAAPSCSDGVKNGAETDVDCGSSCGPCKLGGACATDDDCAGGSCFYGVCQESGWGLHAASVYESGVGPVYAASGDLNGDGLNDVVALNSGGKSIAVLLNSGGVLMPPLTQYAIPSGAGPKQAALTDLDGDGHKDIVVYSSGHGKPYTISTFLNSGSGDLTFADERPVYATSVPMGIGDIDGDSHPDVVLSVSLYGIGWLRGVGDGKLNEVVWDLVPKPDKTGFVMGDFRKSGNLDIVTGNTSVMSSPGYLYPNDGTGKFGAGIPIPASGGFGRPLTTGDFTGDGKLDIIVQPDTMSGKINVLVGDDKGNFTAATTSMPVAFMTPPQPADMDGDGVLDLVAATGGHVDSPEPTLQVWRNDGTGRFSASHAYRSFVQNFWLSDLDGNGTTDVLYAVPGRLNQLDSSYQTALGANLRVLSNTGNGSLVTAPPMAVTPRGPDSQEPRMLNGVSVGDLDGDGDDDIVTCSTYFFSVQTFILEGGHIVDGSRLTSNQGKAFKPYDCVIGDFDGDGMGDVAAVGTEVRIFLSRGRGQLDLVNTLKNAGGIRAAAGDLNGDGLDDLVLAQNGGTSPGVAVVLATGAGNFGPPTKLAVGKVEHVALADLDGDGDLDVSAAVYGTFDPFNPSAAVPGYVRVLRNTGGVLSTATTLQTGDHPTATVAGDFDKDGKVDLAVANGESHDVTIFRGTGASFTKLGSWPVLVNPSDISAGDFNGDGRADLAVATFSSSAVSILLNTGAGQFERRRDYEGGGTSVALAVGDLDRNGMPDVAVASDTGMPMLMNLASASIVHCQPGQATCDGNVVRICNGGGDGFIGPSVPCGPSEACANGACVAHVCASQSTSCDAAGNATRCTLDGLSQEVVDVCQVDEYCDTQELGCQKMVCTPGAAACVNDAVGTCNASGSGLEGGMLCDGTTETCGANACVSAAACTNGTNWCFGGDIWQCKAGVRSVQWVCSAGTHCLDAGAGPGCYANTCTEGQKQCVGDMVRTCNGEGTGWVYSPLADCHALGKICVNSACVDEDINTLWSASFGPTTNHATPLLWTTYVDMDTSRSLKEFAYKFSVPADTEVRYVLFSSDSPTRTYTKIWEAVRTVAAADGFDYHSSGPVGLTLVAGFHYALGYFVPGPQAYAYSTDTLPVTTSFGTVGRSSRPLNFNASSVVGYIPTHYSMRITTAAP